MAIDQKKKDRLKHLLSILSTPDEKAELDKLDVEKVKKIVAAFRESESQMEAEHQESYQRLSESFERFASASQKHSARLSSMLSDMTDGLSKNLEKLGGTITTSYEKNKPFNAAGVYKDMVNQLSSVNQSIRDKPVPVWNWPQYAGVSIRNRSFQNIQPATDAIGIGSFDYVALSQATLTDTYTFYTGGSSGTLVATIVILYTDATKATISTVTKTPVTVQ